MANLMKGLVSVMVNDDGTAGNAALVLHGVRADWSAFVGNASAGNTAIFDGETNENISDTSAFADQSVKSFFIGHHNGTEVVRGPKIFTNDIEFIAASSYVAGTAKEITIDSVSDIDCETEYCLKIRYESPKIRKTYGYQDLVQTYSYVTRCCGNACGCPDGAVWDVLMGLAEQVNNDNGSTMNNSTADTVSHMKVLNSTAATTTNEMDNAITLTKGSSKVTVATAVVWNTTTLVVGDHMRIMTAAGTVSNSDDVFRVEAVDTTNLTFTLDRPWPYAGVTLTGAAGDTEVIVKATAEAFADSTWSAIVVGAGVVTPSVATTDYTPSYVTDINIGLACNLDCNATVTTSTSMVSPKGRGYDVVQQEIWATQNQDLKHTGPYSGNTIYDRPVSGTDYAATGATNYDCLTISYRSHGGSQAIHRNDMPLSKFMFFVTDGFDTFVGTDTGGNGTTDTLLGYFGKLGDQCGWISKYSGNPTAGSYDAVLAF